MSRRDAAAAIQLRHLIYYHLDHDLVSNALYVAGRLHALDPRSPETIHLLALCHFKVGHFRAAYDYARDVRLRPSSASNSASTSAALSCAYVFAHACLALRRYSEGISALERFRTTWQGKSHWNRCSETERRAAPDAAAVCNLLGKLCKANGEEKKAAEWFAESLRQNPFMWDAFIDLSDSGVPLRITNIFRVTDEMRRDLTAVPMIFADPPQPHPLGQVLSTKSVNDPNSLAIQDPFSSTRSALDPGLNHGGRNFMNRLNGNATASVSIPEWNTPKVANGVHGDDDIMMDDINPYTNDSGEAPPAPLRKKGGLQNFMGELIDAPKMRSMTTRGRTKLEPPADEARSGIPISHKRTISGQPPPGTSSMAASHDGTGVRRSNRLRNDVPAVSTAKSTAGSRLQGIFRQDVKEKRELPKARATGTRGRAGTSTVGRVVSGNRKPPGPGERHADAKESSRPASVASTTREHRDPCEPESRRGDIHPNIIVEQQVPHVEEALRWLLDLFAKLAEGYYNLSRYNCQKALETFKSLPVAQRETPWVLTKIGRALYEGAQYADAADVFARVRKLGANVGREGASENSFMDDMHIYSTVLWHQKREIELAYLSHSLLELDRLAPEAWVALGNSFSLQREHEKAIKCFRRATQLSSSSDGVVGQGGAYAFTLMGHEHIAQEEFDKAQLCYREAIASNSRHYAGWYGLGQCYEKLGKYDVAERHYRVAWNINPRNGVLAVCLGLVCEKLGKEGNSGTGAGWVLDPRGEGRVKEALTWYDRAVRMDTKSAKARFMKARTLMRLAQMRNGGGRLDGDGLMEREFADGGPLNETRGGPRQVRLLQAKQELEVLRDMAGDESMVHFLLGRCLKLLGDRQGAIREMTIALELDPKASPHIKEALESLEIDDDGSYDEDDDD